jgi:hypothetical protein
MVVVVGFYFQGGNVVINRLQTESFLKMQTSKSPSELRGQAEQYLNKITILQHKLHAEEENLMTFLRVHGIEVLNFDRFT